MASLCSCPKRWAPIRQQFRAVSVHYRRLTAMRETFSETCESLQWQLAGAANSIKGLFTGFDEEINQILRRMKAREGGCLPGLAVGAYACMATSFLTSVDDTLMPAVNLALPLLAFTAPCLEPGRNMWGLTAGRGLRDLEDIMFGPTADLKPEPLPICFEDLGNPQPSLVGYCGSAVPHAVLLSAAGPLEAIAADDVVLCTHTSGDALDLVEPMLLAWRGPASVAVLSEDAAGARSALAAWVERLGGLGLRGVVVSIVGANPRALTAYDRLYPANVLRQAALDAAVADLVLLADPAFVPSAGFRAVVRDSLLGRAVRGLLAAAPTAFLVASFLLFEDPGGSLDLAGLRAAVEAGSAVPFDAYVCPLCRPHVWQWLLLTKPSLLRFHEARPADLHHPAWLAQRTLLPRLGPQLHGVVKPRSGGHTVGWHGLPCGLRATTEQLRAAGVRTLLLPGAFLQRLEALPVPSRNGDLRPGRFPSVFFGLLLRRFVAALPRRNASGAPPPESLLWGERLVSVAPPHLPHLLTLQQGSDRSLELVIVASVVVGSSGLKRLLASVPWSVHAISVGAGDFWPTAKRDLPEALRRTFAPHTLVCVVDAYDTVLLPCGRSIPAEFAALQRDVVMPAEKTCWPVSYLCRSCEERYGNASADLEACRAFPNLNSGGYIGTASAVAEAFEWMHAQGDRIGRDDQENAWHYYNTFPERVALDHRQRIWSTLCFAEEEKFRVEGCGVFSDYIGGEVCFAHANGGSRWLMLDPWMAQLEERGCRERPPQRAVDSYAGLTVEVPRLTLQGPSGIR